MKKRRSAPFRIYQKTLLIVLFVTCSGAGVFTYSIWKEQQRNTEDTGAMVYPVQYSDKHITQNAIITDPRFTHTVAFQNHGSFLANVLNSFGQTQKGTGVRPPENGTWLWTPIFDITPSYRDQIISGAKKNGIKNIYLSIDSYLDIYTLPDGEEKNVKEKAFTKIIEDFITAAHTQGISVDAEAGWRNWAEPGNEYKAFAVVSYAMEYNRTHAEKFRGFQYDIEPYLLSGYTSDKKTTLRHFINLIHDTAETLRNNDLTLSVTIPEFYDGSTGETPLYFYGLRFGYTIDHLLHVLEQKPGSSIIVMAYRNTAEGKDGAISIAKDEVAAANRSQTNVVVAEETGDVLPPYITFYGTSKAAYETQTAIIKNAFAKDASYNGIATHYINALLSLK